MSKARNEGCVLRTVPLDHLSLPKTEDKRRNIVPSQNFPLRHHELPLSSHDPFGREREKTSQKLSKSHSTPRGEFHQLGLEGSASGLITAKGRQRLSWRPCVYVCVTHTNPTTLAYPRFKNNARARGDGVGRWAPRWAAAPSRRINERRRGRGYE